MFPVRNLRGLLATPVVRRRPAFTALALAAVTLAAASAAAQSVTVSFEHAEYSVPEGYFPGGSISYSQVNIFLSAAPNTFPDGTFDLDSAGGLVIPLTREMLGGATHGVDFYGASATVRFEPDETTAFLRIFPQADDEDEEGEGVKIGFGTPPKGVSIGTPSTATVMFEEPGMPEVNMSLSPGTIAESGGVSTVSAWLGYPTDYDVTVTVRVETGDRSSTDDFTLSENRTLAIAAGSKRSTGTVTVTAVDNLVDEPDKPVWVRGSVTGLPGVTEASARTLYIEDDDELTATLKLSPTSISENAGVSTVTATLNGAADDDVTVTVSAAPVAPAVATDFTLNGTTLTITAGETSSTGTVTITAEDNDRYASAKSVTVTGTVTGSTEVGAPAPQTLTITDDDAAPTVSLELSSSSISEDGGEATVTATLSEAAGELVTVTVFAEAVSPAEAGDFELSANTALTIQAGQTSSTGRVTVAAVNDETHAPDRTVTVTGTVTAGPEGLAAPAAQTLEITEDEDTPTVTLALAPGSISESGGETTVTATLSGRSSEAVTVTVTATPVSPAVAADFTLTGTRLTIAAGDTESTGEVKIEAEDNDLDAPEKRVQIGGSVTGGNGIAAPAPLTLTITDDEDTPTLTLALDPTSISENGGVSTVTASLDGLSSADVVVTVSTTAVEPAVANDFQLSVNRELTIRAGQLASTGTVTISAENNDVDAPDKTLEVTGSAQGGNGVAAPTAQRLTITDDDELPTVTLKLDPTSIGENGGRSTVTASLDRPSSESVTVTVSVAPVSPAVETDFALTGTTLTIGPGKRESTGTVTISAENNDVDAPDKTLEVTGSAQGGRGVADPEVQRLTITGDEETPEVTLTPDPTSISEDGGVSAVTASLDGLSSADVVVTVSATAVAPAVANDFRLSGNRELTITAGQLESTGAVTVSAENNTMDGPNKTIEVAATVSGESGVADPAAQTLTIIDDEGAPTVTLKLGSATISENNGETTVTATLSGTSSEAVTVTVSVTAEAPVVTGDFEQAGTTLTIGVGATESTGEVKITARDNTVDAPDKTVEVTGTVTGGNGAGAPAPLTLTITDDEDTPTLTLALDPASIPENNGETAVTASLDGLSSADVVVTVSAAAVEPAVANDFRLSANRELTITAGQLGSTGTVTIAAENNDVDAPNKTVEVTASAAGGNGVAAPAAQTLTITDDDGTPTLTLTLDPTSIGENGGRSTVTASLSPASSEAVTVTVSVTPVSPAVEMDYQLTGTTLTIGPGETESTGTVTIAAENNDVDAPDKTFEVRGSVQGGGGVSDPAMLVLTIDDDEETPRVVLDLSPSTIEEDGGTSEVRASLTVPSSEPVKVNVDASSMTTPSSARFSRTGPAGAALAFGSRTLSDLGHGFVLSESRELTIRAGETESDEVVTITALDDTVDGPNTTVEVTGTVTGGNGALPPMPKMLKIMDDDGAPAVALVLTPARIGENGGVSTVIAVLSPTSGEPVTVTVSASAESPADGGDFVLSTNRELTIAGGQTQSTGSVTITAVDDDEDGPDKQVTVTGAVTGPTGLAAPSAQTLTITDDDEGGAVTPKAASTLTLVLAPDQISENGGESRVTAQLSGPTATDVTLMVSAEAVSPADANDFTLSASRKLTIAAGETESTGMVTLTAVDNTVANPNRQVTVTASVTGAPGVAAPAAQTLTIVDDDETPTPTPTLTLVLVLAAEQITENGGESRVTAQLSGATATDVTLTVSAEAVSPADANDFALSVNRELTIAAGETESTGMVTLTAVDNTVANPNRQVTVTASVAGAPGLAAPAAQTLTIVDDDASNRPPTFFPTSYEFPLEEERDGRTAEVFLGVVKATDPDDHVVTYTLVESDAGRFAVGASSGTVSYVGPGEDAESGVDRYALKVAARDPDGLEAEATVVVRVVPVNEAPTAFDDAAETPEDLPRVVAVLANDEDPDGDRLQVIAVTAPRHGTTAVAAGGVRYEPAPGYHGPDAFRYTVADAGGLTAEATVTVDVLPVNDPPEALDDAAQTLEDEPVVVDVLANDSDPDGDSLRVIRVTDPSHGSATVAAGGVRYVPAPDYHGADMFRYTVADPEGLTATATATVTVQPVNDAPEAVGAIPEQTLEEGGASVTLDLTPYFADVDGDVLTYAAESSDPAAATVTVAGTTLTLKAVVAGAARVTVTASDPEGLTATQVFGVAVGDRLVRAVLTDTLAALGRGHLSSVRQTVGRRLDIVGGETRRVMVAGQHFDPTAWHRLGPSGLMQTHALLTRAASLRQRVASMNLVGTPADPHLQPLDTTGAFGGFGLSLDQALQGTDVLLSFGGQPEEEAVGRQRRWTIWGQGDLQAFRGTPDTVRDYEGDLRTAYVGVDALAGRRWLFGAAVGRSGGRGTWQAGTAPGRLNTTLTTVYPYLRWGSGDTTVWAVAGAGRGTASLTRAAIGRDDASPLRLTLGLLEGRRRLATVGGGLRIGLRGEASAARLATGEGDDTIDALRAGVRRLRGGVEFTQELNGPRGMKLTPFGAVSARHDDGAGQTGVGLEVAGGMRLRGGRLQVEAQGRRLVLHSAVGYSDHGLSLAASVGAGAYQPGLTLTVRPTWGTAGVGANTLWQDHFQLPSQDIGFDAAGIDAQIGYGLPLAGGRLLEPFGGYGQRAGHGRRLQFGARLGALDQIPGLFGGPVQLEFTGERYDRPGNPSDHRFSMVGVVNFGGPSAKRSPVPRATTESRTAWPFRAADAAPLPRPASAPAPGLLMDVPGAGESAAPAPVDDFLQEPVELAVTAAFDAVPDPVPAPPADVVRREPEPATLEEAAPRRAAAASNRTGPAARTDYQPSWPPAFAEPPAVVAERAPSIETDSLLTDAVATDAGPEEAPLEGRVAPSTLGYVTIVLGVLLWAIWRFLLLTRRERKDTGGSEPGGEDGPSFAADQESAR